MTWGFKDEITSTFMSVVKRPVIKHPGAAQQVPTQDSSMQAPHSSHKHQQGCGQQTRGPAPSWAMPVPEILFFRSTIKSKIIFTKSLTASSPSSQMKQTLPKVKPAVPGSHSNSSTSSGYTYFLRKVATIQSLSIFQAPHLSSQVATSSESVTWQLESVHPGQGPQTRDTASLLDSSFRHVPSQRHPSLKWCWAHNLTPGLLRSKPWPKILGNSTASLTASGGWRSRKEEPRVDTGGHGEGLSSLEIFYGHSDHSFREL